jgi:hypothetical protein
MNIRKNLEAEKEREFHVMGIEIGPKKLGLKSILQLR